MGARDGVAGFELGPADFSVVYFVGEGYTEGFAEFYDGAGPNVALAGFKFSDDGRGGSSKTTNPLRRVFLWAKKRRLALTLCELLTAALQENCGQTKKKAQEMTAKIIGWGAENGHAGVDHYWPVKSRDMSPDERNAMICEEFSGGNLQQVCKKFGCSHQTVYRAMHSQRN